MKFQVLIA
uniref:Uncharacterized protein n=1 Tax=Arundo donax TaxID=35708 RepID=A0A0A9BPB8_ARUDO